MDLSLKVSYSVHSAPPPSFMMYLRVIYLSFRFHSPTRLRSSQVSTLLAIVMPRLTVFTIFCSESGRVCFNTTVYTDDRIVAVNQEKRRAIGDINVWITVVLMNEIYELRRR